MGMVCEIVSRAYSEQRLNEHSHWLKLEDELIRHDLLSKVFALWSQK